MPPRGVKKGTKRARQYEHIKQSAREQGASPIAPRRSPPAPSTRSARGPASRGRPRARPPETCPRAGAAGAARVRAAQGPHEGAALRRGEEARRRGPLEDDEVAAPARGRGQKELASGHPKALVVSFARVPPAGQSRLPCVRRGRLSARVASGPRRACGPEGPDRRPGARHRRGAERRPWRGRAGRTLRAWLELDEDAFYETFYCVSITRCYPGGTLRPRRPYRDAGRDGSVLVLAGLGAAPTAARARAPRGRPRGSAAARPQSPHGMCRRAVSARRGHSLPLRTLRARAAGSTTWPIASASARPRAGAEQVARLS